MFLFTPHLVGDKLYKLSCDYYIVTKVTGKRKMEEENKQIEKRINWLMAINKNRVKRRVFQTGWHLVDSEGYKLDLKPLVDANLHYASPSLVYLDFPLSRYDDCLDLEENTSFKNFKLSRLEASLILGKDSQIYANAEMRNCDPRFDKYKYVKNWELQAMLFVAISDYTRGSYYSFGRFVAEPTSRNRDKLIIPVQYYSGRRVECSQPLIDLGNWSERKLIKELRKELRIKLA